MTKEVTESLTNWQLPAQGIPETDGLPTIPRCVSLG